MPAFFIETLGHHSTIPTSQIVGIISLAYSQRHVDQKQELTKSWESTIDLLKAFYFTNHESIPGLADWSILYEYSIPRRSKRIDVVLLSQRVIYVLELKVGQDRYLPADARQLEDYCFDLRDFHSESKNRIVIPILLSTDAPAENCDIEERSNFVKKTQHANIFTLGRIINESEKMCENEPPSLNGPIWNTSAYLPTPTIIEAAQTLYAKKSVASISRNQAGIENLGKTTEAVLKAIRHAQKTNSKAICFITGVPGAGKTLAGLNIVHSRDFQANDKDIGIFLSGNSPLVKVLSEALARDLASRTGLDRTEARRQVSTFIQNVHTFIDDYYDEPEKLPPDRVLIYDEAQRAWTAQHKARKSKGRITASEPDVLLSIMSRFEGWGIIICLVGGGQEINTGEAGLREWGRSLETEYGDWSVYISPNLKEGDHSTGHATLFESTPASIDITADADLHLQVDIRAIRSKGVSEWVSSLLRLDEAEAQRLFEEEMSRFPVFLTRDVNAMRDWLRNKVDEASRTGIIASSGGRRLRPLGYDPYYGLRGDSSQQELGAWYLNPPGDVRASNFLEIVATEYAIQGLEIDWAGVLWDADMRLVEGEWQYRAFKGTKWQRVGDQQKQYTLNKYRVLLTRAREGLIICVPNGDPSDPTRLPQFYDGTFTYLRDIGIPVI